MSRHAVALLTALVLSAVSAHAYTTDTKRTTESSPAQDSSGDAQVDPSSGAARYSYAFEVPPGTAGLTPRLSLEYSSQMRGSEYGYGWNLNLGQIERSTRFGGPAYHDPAQVATSMPGDVFELDGQLLVRDGVSNNFFPRRADGSRVTYRPSGGGFP